MDVMEDNENVVVEVIGEEQMQVDEQDVEDQQEDENIFPNDVQNNEENIPTENSQQTNAASTNLNVSDMDSDQTCPICLEQWTTSGEHRLCCLRCGHLFGYNCILRWLQHSCNSTNRRCPQCNKKAAVKHIRMLYAKKLTTIDFIEYNKLKKDLINVSTEKNLLQIELLQTNTRIKIYEDQMKKRITELESQNSRINTGQISGYFSEVNKYPILFLLAFLFKIFVTAYCSFLYIMYNV